MNIRKYIHFQFGTFLRWQLPLENNSSINYQKHYPQFLMQEVYITSDVI